MLSWFKKNRRSELLAQPVPDEWLRHVHKNVGHFTFLDEDEKRRLLDKVKLFVAEKEWVGRDGLQVTEEMKVTIAAQACLMILGIAGDYCFDGVKTIFVNRSAYGEPAWMQQSRGQLIVTEDPFLLGQAWHRGPIVLSWDDVLQGGHSFRSGQNLVFHEFAHHLDGLNGDMDGVPPLRSGDEYRAWYRVTEDEYARLVRQNNRGDVTLIDGYGATNMAEFFAVSTECFFQRPVELRDRHPELYDVLRGFYHQNPAEWQTGNAKHRPAHAHGRRGQEDNQNWQAEEPSVHELSHALGLGRSSGDAHFTRGILHLNDGDFERAIRDFNSALKISPNDGEAYSHRARAYLGLGENERALEDATKAIDQGIDELDVFCTRAEALARLGRFEQAQADCRRALRHDKKSAWAWYIQGHIAAGQGQYPQAVQHFTQAIRFDPHWAEAYLDRADCYQVLAQPKKAAADRAEAYRRDPSLCEE